MHRLVLFTREVVRKKKSTGAQGLTWQEGGQLEETLGTGFPASCLQLRTWAEDSKALEPLIGSRSLDPHLTHSSVAISPAIRSAGPRPWDLPSSQQLQCGPVLCCPVELSQWELKGSISQP